MSKVFEIKAIGMEVLSFVPDNYLFNASVSKNFNAVYTGVSTCTKETYISECVKSIDRFNLAKLANLPLSYNVTKIASKEGNLEVLQSAVDFGCPWNKEAVYSAAQEGHIDVLQWLISLPMPERRPIYPQNLYYITVVYYYAALAGHLNIIKWLRENDYPWNNQTSTGAAEGGHLEILKWLKEQECPMDEVCAAAAEGDQMEVLKWAREQGYSWDRDTCCGAAGIGNLEMLKWLREHDCPWDELTCTAAARGGHFEVLQWAIANGCPN
jgi:hypothetical protein